MNNLKLLCFTGLLFLLIGTAHAAETTLSGAPAYWPEPVLDSQPYSLLLFDQLEHQSTDGSYALRWDVLGWFGGYYNRLWIYTEGEHRTDGDGGEIERIDVQYGRLIAPFWVFQVGLGY
jgi:copper resistance protein B